MKWIFFWRKKRSIGIYSYFLRNREGCNYNKHSYIVITVYLPSFWNCILRDTIEWQEASDNMLFLHVFDRNDVSLVYRLYSTQTLISDLDSASQNISIIVLYEFSWWDSTRILYWRSFCFWDYVTKSHVWWSRTQRLRSCLFIFLEVLLVRDSLFKITLIQI